MSAGRLKYGYHVHQGALKKDLAHGSRSKDILLHHKKVEENVMSPKRPVYLDCRFETDMKLLLGKLDRMEALMEKMVEAIFYSREASDSLPHKRPRLEETYEDSEMLPDPEEAYLEAEEEEEVLYTADVEEESVYDIQQVEEEPVVTYEAAPEGALKLNYTFPITSVGELEMFDASLGTDKTVKEVVMPFFEELVVKEKGLKDVVKKIATDEVLVDYVRTQDLRNLCIFSTVLKEAYSKHWNANQYWMKFDTFAQIYQVSLSVVDNEIAIDNFRLPLKSGSQIAALNERISKEPNLMAEMTKLMRALYLKCGGDETNFLQRLIAKSALDECGPSTKTKKPFALTNYLMFHSIYADIVKVDKGSKDLEEKLRSALNKLRHRFYSQDHRKRQKEVKIMNDLRESKASP